ncbi:MAG: hypothetical protein A2Y00_00920 [Omnitrophica WOR_2 bacterium GWF2_43_52]|nr:MAG: hypothetical protein A2Y00_00920 [Omnitrophica WOR_2 bacterium GWF2_43_52]
MIVNSGFRYVYAGLRRRVIFYFCKGYFNRQLTRRRGACNQEGACCKQTIPCCPHLRGNACSIYSAQPLFCKIFPVDLKDLELSDVKGVCAYSFDRHSP